MPTIHDTPPSPGQNDLNNPAQALDAIVPSQRVSELKTIYKPLQPAPGIRHRSLTCSCATIFWMQKLTTAKLPNTWRIMCKRCGKLRPPLTFPDIKRARICSECFQPPAVPTLDLVKHVQQLFVKKPGKPWKPYGECVDVYPSSEYELKDNKTEPVNLKDCL